MTIKNNAANDGTGSFTGNLSNVILNAYAATYKVDNTSKVIGSIINAYNNAVIFDSGENLTLSGTIVNGSIQGSHTENNTLILQAGDIEYTNGIKEKADTIINGNIDMWGGNDTVTIGKGAIVNGDIDMGAGNDTLNIENGSIINGILNGEDGNDTLNLGVASSTKTIPENSEEIGIFVNISRFENININSNVTFYEKDSFGENIEVTGAENITIKEKGMLTLRIDSSERDSTGDIIGHALYNDVAPITLGGGTTVSSTDGGKLLLSLDRAGNESVINWGTATTLDNTMIGIENENSTIGSTSLLHLTEKTADNKVRIFAKSNLPTLGSTLNYVKLNRIYKGIKSVDGLANFSVVTNEGLSAFTEYLNDIYAGSPYSFSSELSRKSAGMFRDIVTANQFKPNLNNWLIYGGLTHADGGTKDTYYGKGYFSHGSENSSIKADTRITGAYMLGEYGVSDNLTSGIIIGGNKLKSDLSNGSKADGSALYLGVYAKKHLGNLKVTAGLGLQYGDYDVDRLAVNGAFSSNYNDISYDIYLNGRYSNPIGDNLYLEPYGTLSYTYTKQDGANEGSKALAIETDSKSFDYTVGKVGLDLKKIIPHSNGKSTLTAGVSYTKILDGAEEEYITGRFKVGSDFDILIAHKNEHSIGLNTKYTLELESGILFDVKGTYSVERDSHNNSGKNKTKGEWIVGTGLGYKF